MVSIRAHFDGKVFVPDEPVDIPVGTPLRVIIDSSIDGQAAADVWRRLDTLAQECAVDGPDDLAECHDHYAHGKPLA